MEPEIQKQIKEEQEYQEQKPHRPHATNILQYMEINDKETK